MTREEHEKVIQSIQEKIGNETSGVIADDLGILISDNAAMNETISNKENEINQLQKSKDMLAVTNNKLLQQVRVQYK